MGKLSLLAGLTFVSLLPAVYWPGGAIVVDPGYRLERLPLERDIGAVDGLFWHEGWLYAASEGSSAVYRIDSQGRVETLATRAQFLSSPEDLVVDDQGAVYFTDDEAGGAWRIPPGDRAVRLDSAAQPLKSTEGIARLSSGELLIGDGKNGDIVVFNAQGQPLERFEVPGIRKPESLAAGDDGSVYIADNRGGCIVRRTAAGQTEVLLDRGDGLQAPETIAFQDHTLYVVDNKAGRLLRFRPGGALEPIAQFGGQLKNLQGIAIGDGGTIYLSVQTDLRRNRGHLLRLVPSAVRRETPSGTRAAQTCRPERANAACAGTSVAIHGPACHLFGYRTRSVCAVPATTCATSFRPTVESRSGAVV